MDKCEGILGLSNFLDNKVQTGLRLYRQYYNHDDNIGTYEINTIQGSSIYSAFSISCSSTIPYGGYA